MHPVSKMKRLCRGWSRCVRVGLLSLFFVLWLTLRPHEARSDRGLDVWLDKEQARRLLGINVPYYFIQNDRPSALPVNAQTRHLSTRSRFHLSRETRYLNISFSAPVGYHYTIDEVSTSNPNLVGHPVFSVPTRGDVPTKHTVFNVEFPCSGREAGTALVTFGVRFQTDNYDGKDIRASPLFFQIEKECGKETKACKLPCLAGGECVDGRCECKDGYYGLRCEQIICNPKCYNGGKCVSPGVCACTKGFSGKFCHLASCKDNCYNHGRCLSPGTCKCYRNWTGDYCQQPVTQNKPRSTALRIQQDVDDSLDGLDEDQLHEDDSSSK